MKPTAIIYTDENGFECRESLSDMIRNDSEIHMPKRIYQERDELLQVIEIQRAIIRDLVNCPDYKGINTHEMRRARAAISTD